MMRFWTNKEERGNVRVEENDDDGDEAVMRAVTMGSGSR